MTNIKVKQFLGKWYLHPLPLDHINLNTVLYNGQSFRWKWYDHDTKCMQSQLNALLEGTPLPTSIIKIHYNSVNLSATDSSHILKLCQSGKNLYYSTPDSNIAKHIESFLTSMLQLNIDRLELYKNISKLDKHLEKLLVPHLSLQSFETLECTIMKLPPWETLLSFICSSNNNIKRISSMCDKLCEIGGETLGYIQVPVYDNNTVIDFQEKPIYAFPGCEKLLANCNENMLKEAKFGYRAKYIMQTAELFAETKKQAGFEDLSDSAFMCLNISPSVNNVSYKQAKEWLVQFSGCGPKVADCVLLYSEVSPSDNSIVKKDESEIVKLETMDLVRNWNGIIPIDAHITRIALRDFPHIIKKNNKNLELMRETLMNRFGHFGGWIQVLLFTKEIEKTPRK